MDRPRSDETIRVKILEAIYLTKRSGKAIQMSPHYYATLLGISDELASFNIDYLIQTGLLRGFVEQTTASTPKRVFVTDITASGVREIHSYQTACYSGETTHANYSFRSRASRKTLTGLRGQVIDRIHAVSLKLDFYSRDFDLGSKCDT